MKEAFTKYDLTGQTRRTRAGKIYKIVSFSKTCFINNHCTWLIEYEDGKRFYKPEVTLLKDKVVKGKI